MHPTQGPILHAAEYRGCLVLTSQKPGEAEGVMCDRSWLVARLLSRDPFRAQTARSIPIATMTSEAWSAVHHLGCGYDAPTMQAIEAAERVSHVPRTHAAG
jgi:hypothetical protein